MLHARFQLVNPRNVYFGTLANNRGGIFRHESSFGKRFRGGQLDIQPLLEAIRIAPNLAHFLACVTRNQTVSPWALLESRPIRLSKGLADIRFGYGRCA